MAGTGYSTQPTLTIQINGYGLVRDAAGNYQPVVHTAVAVDAYGVPVFIDGSSAAASTTSPISVHVRTFAVGRAGTM